MGLGMGMAMEMAWRWSEYLDWGMEGRRGDLGKGRAYMGRFREGRGRGKFHLKKRSKNPIFCSRKWGNFWCSGACWRG